MAGFDMKDYVDVHQRIEKFYEKFPEGSIQTEVAKLDDSIVIMRAYAYRNPDDPRPSIGHSQLGIPGTTPYTRGSEIENAETSAVGRAIAFLGFETKNGIASAQEVRNKQTDTPRKAPSAPQETPQKPVEPVSEKLEFPDWMKKAQKMAGEKKTRFKDIPALKIHESATAVDVKNALIAWRISVSEGQKNAGDQWVLEQFATILPQEVPA